MKVLSAAVRQHEADKVSGYRQPALPCSRLNRCPFLCRRRDRKAYPLRRQPAAVLRVFGDRRAASMTGSGTAGIHRPALRHAHECNEHAEPAEQVRHLLRRQRLPVTTASFGEGEVEDQTRDRHSRRPGPRPDRRPLFGTAPDGPRTLQHRRVFSPKASPLSAKVLKAVRQFLVASLWHACFHEMAMAVRSSRPSPSIRHKKSINAPRMT